MRQTNSILFALAGDPAEGAPHQAMAALWLHSRGRSVEIISMGPADRREFSTPLGTLVNQIIPAGRGFSGKIAWQFRLFVRLLRARFSDPPPLFYLQGHGVTPAACFALACIKKSRLIYHTQDYLEPARHPIWAFWERRLARRCKYIICNEVNRARFMASSYRLKKMPIVVRTALPIKWPQSKFDTQLRTTFIRQAGLDPSAEYKLVLHQGGFSPVRCTEQLLEALTLLPSEYLLVFTGTSRGSASFVTGEQLAGRLGLAGRIIYLDRLPFDELLRHTACCDIGVLLYPDDGIGNFYQAPGRLTEYLSCGLPVVASAFPGLELLTLKYGLGTVCNPTNPQEIAKALLSIGERSAEAVNLERSRLRKLFLDEFIYDQQAKQIEEMIRCMVRED